MDMFNKAKDMLNNSGNNSNANNGMGGGATMGGNAGLGGNAGMGGNNVGAGTQNEDYGDKGLDFVEKKTGHTLGRNTNEKITDGARNMYEKATGKTVNPKISN